MLGTGEYTTGWVGKKSDSDKSTGVVGLVMLDLKRRGKVGRLGMCGTNGTKLPAIRDHMAALGEAYEGSDPSTIETFPADDVVDREARRVRRAARHDAVDERPARPHRFVLTLDPLERGRRQRRQLEPEVRVRRLLTLLEVGRYP